MAAAPIIQGWCPGALRPMVSGDGLVVRVRPRGGRLSAVQAAGLARLAIAHGNGLIDLSARANVQLRGVTEAGYPALLKGLRGLGLLDSDPATEARRNIVVSPFWTDGDGVQAIVALLEQALAAKDAPDLPGKFGFSVDGSGSSLLGDVSADVRIERYHDGWLVLGDSFVTGAITQTREAAVAAAIALSRWFLAEGGALRGRGRMAQLWADAPQTVRHARLPARFTLAKSLGHGFGPIAPLPGPSAVGQLVGLEFGQIDAGTLLGLSALGAVRVTPWRMLLIEGLQGTPDLPGLITRADDPMLRVVACTGAPGCLQAHQPTRVLARALARALAPLLTETLHVSGCAKGCAHPAAAPVTLVGTPEGFDLVLSGRTTDTPIACTLTDPDTIARQIKARS